MARIKETERKELIQKYKQYVLNKANQLPLEDDPECVNIIACLPMWLSECYSIKVVYNIVNSSQWEFISEKNEIASQLCGNTIAHIERKYA